MNGCSKASVSVPELIVKKRDGDRLSRREIDSFIDSVVNKEIQESQIGAMLMAIYLRGMDEAEIVDLTRSMMMSGDVMEWPEEWQGHMVDKHSTGGVGDKVSLPLAPALAACDVKVPMISGRGLGYTGGTLDKLEAIPGYNVSQSMEDMKAILEKVGCCIVGQTSSLVPADRILYATRDVTGTVESNPLIAGSIVSKKAAENLSALILDVKCGKGANLKTVEQGRELANIMVKIGKGLGVETTAVISDMDNPLGKNIGNALEIIESIECLHGRGPRSLRNIVTTLGGHLLFNAGKVLTPEIGKRQIAEKLDNGEALEKWCAMLKMQGVAPRVADDLCKKGADYSLWLPTATQTFDIKAYSSGYVSSIDALACAKVCKGLGAGRTQAGQEIDLAVGLELQVEVGDYIKHGQTWATVHFNNDLPISYIAELEDAITIQKAKCNGAADNQIKEIIH